MAYLAEVDGSAGRQEIRRGYASNVIRWWPKWPGVGSVLLTSTPTATLHKPGASTEATGSAVVSMTTIESVSRVNITIDTTDANTWTLDEGYRADITWSYTDSDAVAHTEITSVRFDVCREPWRPEINLSNLQDLVPDIAQRLLSCARSTKSDRTAEQLASVQGCLAWEDIRQHIVGLLSQQARIIPRALLPREALHRITCAQTIRSLFLGTAGGEDSENNTLAAIWTDEVNSRLRGLGSNIPYDADDDGAEDSTISGPSSVVVRRSWY